MANPQKENGYTGIANDVIDHLVKSRLLGAELALLLFVIRKTWGYQKKDDIISLSQFENCLDLSRVTVNKTIKNLIAKNILVKTYLPLQKISFRINKDYDSWILVNVPLLVKARWRTSKGGYTETSKGGYTHKRKKENIQKKREGQSPSRIKSKKEKVFSAEGAEIIKAFEGIDAKNKNFYNNTVQRKACDDLIENYTLESVLKIIPLLPKTNKKPRYEFPHISTPYQLLQNWVKLYDGLMMIKGQKEEKQSKSKIAFTS